MPIAASAVLQVTMQWVWGGSHQVRNIHHYRQLTAEGDEDEDVVATVGPEMTDRYAYIKALLPDELVLEGVGIYDLTADRPIGVYVPVPSFAGTNLADPYALGVAAVVRFLTGEKRSQGRKFIGPLTESSFAGEAVLVASSILALAQFGAACLTHISTSSAYAMPGVYRASTAVFYPFTEAIVNAVPGYQRRRKQGVGI